jgi:hypothetical protein
MPEINALHEKMQVGAALQIPISGQPFDHLMELIAATPLRQASS